ncbi:MAG: PolC-type DNA polymerase III [Ruminococcaceae bacterium]|nr:PolC-type DNA polymerase III [Oscillospiraceae bacterium]
MAKNLKDFFPGNVPDFFDKAFVTDLKINLSERSIFLCLKPDYIFDDGQTECIKKEFANEYSCEKIQLKFDYKDITLNSKNLPVYAAHIESRAEHEIKSILKLVLMNSVWRINGDEINIITKFGMDELIKKFSCERVISDFIFEETGMRYKINIGGEYDEAEYEKFEQEKQAALNEASKTVSEYIEKQKLKEQTELANEVTSTEIMKNEIEPEKLIRGKKIIDPIITPIKNIRGPHDKIVVAGDIWNVESKELKSGKTIVSFNITDYTSSIKVKMFEGAKSDEKDEQKKQKQTDKLNELLSELKENMRLMVSGKIEYDTFSGELTLMCSSIVKIAKEERMDNAEEKRVELHMHTQMSAMDATGNVEDIVKLAIKWGHKAVAVTDHGVAQAFPDAFKAKGKNDIKILYGMEGYLEGNKMRIVYDAIDYSVDGEFVVFDIETTGLHCQEDKIIEIGAVKIKNGNITERFSTFVNPHMKLSQLTTELTSIKDSDVENAPSIEEVLPKFLDFCKNTVLVAHNATFDVGFIRVNAARLSLPFEFCYVDTLNLCRALYSERKTHSLAAMTKHLNIELLHHHRAVDDAEATAEIMRRCIELLKKHEITNLKDFNKKLSDFNPARRRDYHIILLAKDKAGLVNLYRIISDSNLNHFNKHPVIVRETLEKYREGLILGSACESGELFNAILMGESNEEIEKIAQFYDYLEIQPIGNNEFLKREGMVTDDEGLREYNRRIVRLGEKLGKPVAATCDVHFIEEKDEVFRRILMASKGFEDADYQPPLYFRTTEEMLKEFEYLGEEKAKEVVITVPNMIADSIDDILLLPKEPSPPKIEGAEEELIKITKEKAISIYGDPLPKIVQSRMDRELSSIIKYGFSVMYIIAKNLVWKSNADGYLVGSRGSVGSSFIAFLAGITEVNALQPHYVCKKCKHSEFITDGSQPSGWDLPDKYCPNCGELMYGDGHDIPFETFLGFEGDKEPDIDLNFSGDYQPKAHKYTEVLFGEGFVFRAGTIGTVADKTAYGYVKKYFEERGLTVASCEMERLAKGCTGVKRTTGQHPGGIMVVPRDNDIHNFCPIQHPADDPTSDIITTHFDYHSISGKLLKLDILGHDDPTVIRMLEDLTGLDSKTIKIGEKKVMTLFESPEALGVTSEAIFSPTGTYGISEFGTPFVRKMLVDTHPTTFAELVRISGLSHGTNVWLDNAQTLVTSGTATLKECICTRDDIMTYLIYAGCPKKESFSIMEHVRKGKGLTPEEEQLMRDNNVPEWYIESCKKIKYLFPKAHAVAYVMMAFRVAYFKVYYPKEYYAVYFTVRADAFDAEYMAVGKEKVKENLLEFKSKEDASVKEKDMVTILELCNEMYERGIEFLPIDIYESDANKFLPKENGILLPLNAIAGFGGQAAESVVEARKDGPFMTIDDLRERTKVSKTLIQVMREKGYLDGIPETSQVNLFEM